MVHVLSYEGNKISSYRPHSAIVTSIRIDEENEIIATASFEGEVLEDEPADVHQVGS